MQLINEKIVAKIIDRSVQTLRNERAGKIGIPFIKIGRSVRYDLDEINKFIESRRISTEDK